MGINIIARNNNGSIEVDAIESGGENNFIRNYIKIEK